MKVQNDREKVKAMIRTLGVDRKSQLLMDIPLDQLNDENIVWYWVDFCSPTEAEAALLHDQFHFHPLAVEDCLHVLQRPKLDHYEDAHFFVLHAIQPGSLLAEEVDLFVGPRFLVTFHWEERPEVDQAWRKISGQSGVGQGASIWGLPGDGQTGGSIFPVCPGSGGAARRHREQ